MSREFCRDVPDPWGCSKTSCKKLGQKSCRTKVSRIFRIFVPNFAPNFAPNFPRIFRGLFVLRFVGNGAQKKLTKNPRHFSMQNSQANTKTLFTKFFWRAGKVTKKLRAHFSFPKKKEPQTPKIARTAPKNVLNKSRALPNRTRVLSEDAMGGVGKEGVGKPHDWKSKFLYRYRPEGIFRFFSA